MTDEAFNIGIKVITVITIIVIAFETILAIEVLKKRRISTSILDDIGKDVSNSELLKEQDLNEINLEDCYVEE